MCYVPMNGIATCSILCTTDEHIAMTPGSCQSFPALEHGSQRVSHHRSKATRLTWSANASEGSGVAVDLSVHQSTQEHPRAHVDLHGHAYQVTLLLTHALKLPAPDPENSRFFLLLLVRCLGLLVGVDAVWFQNTALLLGRLCRLGCKLHAAPILGALSTFDSPGHRRWRCPLDCEAAQHQSRKRSSRSSQPLSPPDCES